MKKYKSGNILGLDFSIRPAGFLGSLVLFVAACLIGVAVLSLGGGEAIVLGFLCVVLHWLAELLHQLGHARAARQTGHPMHGIRFGTLGLLSTAVYPADEPTLPAATHIHRALGGPKSSAVFSVLAAILVVALWNTNAILRWSSAFFFLDNLLVLTIGAFLPLGFTDGSTILHWRGKA
jgi:hypothetical protein